MTSGQFAFLYAWTRWGTCLALFLGPTGIGIAFASVPLFVATSACVATICLAHVLISRPECFWKDEAPVSVTSDGLVASFGSRREVRFEFITEAVILKDPISSTRYYFVRTSDGAWCAFETRHTPSDISTRLAPLTRIDRKSWMRVPYPSERADPW